MSLKVIGAGFGRTGTDSMRLALNKLGFGLTHHMLEIIEKPDEQQSWRDVALGAPPDWDHLFEGYSSCVDWPSAFYWRELSGVYPEARVLLTWRSPESWWTSFENTILKALLIPDDPNSLGQSLIAEQVFGGRPDDREHAINVYQDHVDDVMATVPADRLLLHKIGDGWEPLCAHLGVAVPKEGFPKRNSTSEFLNRFKKS